MKALFMKNDEKSDFNIITCELCDNERKIVCAGEIGYTIGKTYTSLSGFFIRKDRRYDNFGKLQLYLLAKLLLKQGYEFWNLGHPYMQYKIDLGANILDRNLFLSKWLKYRDLKSNNELINTIDIKFFFHDLL